MYQVLDAPLSAHLEFTSSCNHKCRHCYNYWRSSEDIPSIPLTKELATKIIEQLSKNSVFHVILTGGEPLLNMDVLVFAMNELKKRDISFSLNSNVTLLTNEMAERLRNAGLKTILVSLLSYEENIQDYITNRSGSHERTLRGIKIARENGIRIAINMVVSKTNLSHVKATGLFAKSLGSFAFSATRVMPPRYEVATVNSEFILDNSDVRKIMKQMVELKDSGMFLESLVPYPTCFFESPDEVQIFGGRTCSAGKTSCAIASNGMVRACPHHEVQYGELENENLSTIWKRMNEWRDGSLIPDECKKCSSIGHCGGGCRVAAPEKVSCSKDPAMKNAEDALFMTNQEIQLRINLDTLLKVSGACRFRNDATMGIINTGSIKNTFVSHDTFRLLKEVNGRRSFTPREIIAEFSLEMGDSEIIRFLNSLVYKNVLKLIE
ncbi:MAG: radical SAM protein [Candidatus Jorgensenbacteria bacterium]|nr:radical SAM protein [Candidatus Jorgensenbacteria bacterium]